MKPSVRLADLRDRVEIYEVTSQSNSTTKLPEDLHRYFGCFFAKIERSMRPVEADGKTNIEEIYNLCTRSENCKKILPEMKLKWSNKYMQILDIQMIDIHFNKIVVKFVS